MLENISPTYSSAHSGLQDLGGWRLNCQTSAVHSLIWIQDFPNKGL